MHAKKRGFLLIMALVASAILATRIQEVDVPIWQRFADANRVNPLTLHLQGEFVESNLGTALEVDGVTVRLIAQQFSFVPSCVKVPAGTPVKFRLTSADVTHGFILGDTNVNTMVVPGFVSEVRTSFAIPGDYRMPCHEFCGLGHQGIGHALSWSR